VLTNNEVRLELLATEYDLINSYTRQPREVINFNPLEFDELVESEMFSIFDSVAKVLL
jgi:hypothetical protein